MNEYRQPDIEDIVNYLSNNVVWVIGFLVVITVFFAILFTSDIGNHKATCEYLVTAYTEVRNVQLRCVGYAIQFILKGES